MSDAITILKCPRCGEKTQWQNNPTRPFCSERCKLIDLGAWASDEYKLGSDPAKESNTQAQNDDDAF